MTAFSRNTYNKPGALVRSFSQIHGQLMARRGGEEPLKTLGFSQHPRLSSPLRASEDQTFRIN